MVDGKCGSFEATSDFLSLGKVDTGSPTRLHSFLWTEDLIMSLLRSARTCSIALRSALFPLLANQCFKISQQDDLPLNPFDSWPRPFSAKGLILKFGDHFIHRVTPSLTIPYIFHLFQLSLILDHPNTFHRFSPHEGRHRGGGWRF